MEALKIFYIVILIISIITQLYDIGKERVPTTTTVFLVSALLNAWLIYILLN